MTHSEIEALLGKITPGKWEFIYGGPVDRRSPGVLDDGKLRVYVDIGRNFHDLVRAAQFIFDSPSIIRQLLDEVKAYRQTAIEWMMSDTSNTQKFCERQIDAEARRLMEKK